MSSAVLGPSGGVGGQPFDDEPTEDGARLREIRVWAGNTIDAVQLVVEIEGQTIERPKHGGAGGNLGIVRLADDEYVTEIYGRYGSYIEQLSIRTNNGQTGRFGGRGGANEFLYVAPDGYKIVGLWGRAGRILDAIGVHIARVASRDSRQPGA